MKNLYILPTDKPSRLYKTGNFLLLDSKAMPNNTLETMNQHIYITSDEEIKEGDWYLTFTNNEVMGQPRKCEDTNWNFSHCKKIILTTDPELIKDGVQAIGDEFLEWFVKNPSCDFVEVIKEPLIIKGEADYFNYDNGTKLNTNVGKYKIIIPKEEPKQSVQEYEQQGLEKYSHELKQETLEEAAETLYPINNTGGMFMPNREEVKNIYRQEGFIAGVKSDAARDYWFEQFKKK
jgi:hypothetical protein